jgi:hypothetical protein
VALSASMVWEFRATATAANVNGGGFNPNNAASNTTDYSKQDAAQYGFSDLATSSGTTNPSVVTSASHSFVTADVGNLLHILSGTSWLAGWYEIVSVSGGAATLDRACGSAASLTAGTYNVGGAMSLGSISSGRSDTTLAAAIISGHTVWIKSGSYTGAAGMTFGNGLAVNSPVKVYGYQTTRGDSPTGNNRPVIDMGVNTWTMGTNNVCENVRFTGTANGVVLASGRSRWNNVKVNNTSGSADQTAFTVNTSGPFVIGSEFSSTLGSAITCNAAGTVYMQGCYIHDSKVGITNGSGTAGSSFMDCIFSGMSTTAFDQTGTANSLVQIYGCTLYGSEAKVGTGIKIGASATDMNIYNNIIYGFVTGISDANGVGCNFGDYNCLFNNTTNYSTFTAGAHDLLVNPQFVNAAGGNFAVGSNLKALGYPSAYPGGLSTSYVDIGAVQRAEPVPVYPSKGGKKVGLLKQSTARNVTLYMVSSTDHITPATGLTLSVQLSKDGASFVGISPSVTEIGNGWYSIVLTTTHTNTLGDLSLRVTATGADTLNEVHQVVPDLPGVSTSEVLAIKAKTDNLPDDPSSNTVVGDNANLIITSVSGISTQISAFRNAYSFDDLSLISSRAAADFMYGQDATGFEFLMTDSTTHLPAVGLSPTVEVNNGGGWSASVNNPTEVGLGVYSIDLTAAEMSGFSIALRLACTGADTRIVTIRTQS